MIKTLSKLQNNPQLICISLNNISVYCVMPRSTKHFDTCKRSLYVDTTSRNFQLQMLIILSICPSRNFKETEHQLLAIVFCLLGFKQCC